MSVLKKIYSGKRLDRIAPKCDRAFITVAAVLLFASLALGAVSLILNFIAEYVFAISANAAGYALWIISEFFIIKETIRNRFFSVVLLLILSIAFLMFLIACTVLISG